MNRSPTPKPRLHSLKQLKHTIKTLSKLFSLVEYPVSFSFTGIFSRKICSCISFRMLWLAFFCTSNHCLQERVSLSDLQAIIDEYRARIRQHPLTVYLVQESPVFRQRRRLPRVFQFLMNPHQIVLQQQQPCSQNKL